MNDSQKMIEIWRKWEAQIKDLGTDLAVTSAMNEWHETKVKNLDLHGVSKSFVSGSKVEITGCFIGHEFEIGEIVTLIEENGEQWLAENSKGERWYIIPEETNAC